MSERRVLVTGATGFIGRYLIKHLKREGDIVLGTSTSASDVDYIMQMNLLDADQVTKVIKNFSPTHVVHLAAIASVSQDDYQSLYLTNIVGTQKLLEAIRLYAPHIVRVILASTAGVYGNQNVKSLTEDLPFNPSNDYSISKVGMELLSRQYKDDFDVTIIRPFNIIGVGQNPIFLIPKLTRLFAIKSSIIEVGNISSVRDYVDVDSCIDVICKLLEHDGTGVFNICSGVGFSGDEIIQMLINITGHIPIIKKIDDLSRRSEVWSLVGSVSKLNTVAACRDNSGADVERVLLKMVHGF